MSVLKLQCLQSIDLDKNNFTEFYSSDLTQDQIQLDALTYLNLNGNSLVEIPSFLRFIPNLKQLLLHMNKITSVDPLCRSQFSGLEVLDLGGNKIETLPVALIYFLKGLCQLTLTNNEIQKLPNMIGIHKSLKNIQVEGNPLKSIRRTIIDKGSAGILRYLMDRYVEPNDNVIEQWALDQDQADIKQ